jgi:hypothetical protein
MTFREIADSVGVGEYTPLLDEVYASLTDMDTPACDISLIDSLQSEWNLFGEFYELVRALALEVNQDIARSAWVKVTAKYAMCQDDAGAREVPVPQPDGTAVTAMLPLYTLLPIIPVGIQEYRARGFSDEEVAELLKQYRSGIAIVKKQSGMPGINKTYYNWLMHFAKAIIFQTDGMQFELRQLPENVVYLKNKVSGEVLPIMNSGIIHKSGLNMLGSGGFEDADGSFCGEFLEDDKSYYGYACIDSKVQTKCGTYSKAELEVFLRPGDDCLSIHIPRGTDISNEALDRYFAAGRQIARERYPEHNGVAIFGSSWILDPNLIPLVGPESKIAGLQSRFIKYPQKTTGKDCFSFVFGKPNYEDYQELPEQTSLQRKLKQLYLSGGCTHSFAGIVIE